MDYHIVSQGKTTIPSVDDNEEMELTDVRIFIVNNVTLSIKKIYPLHNTL